MNEKKDAIYDKINRRIAHVTGLKANSSLQESEDMLVTYLKIFTIRFTNFVNKITIRKQGILNVIINYILVRQLWNWRSILESLR